MNLRRPRPSKPPGVQYRDDRPLPRSDLAGRIPPTQGPGSPPGTIGFVGRVEYRHVYGQSGGARYGRGAGGDVLITHAEAFERDADTEDFSLLAIVAHERGHQLVAQHPRLSPFLSGVSPAAEEVLASLLNAMALDPGPDREALVEKATFDVLRGGASVETADRVVRQSWTELEGLL